MPLASWLGALRKCSAALVGLAQVAQARVTRERR